MICVVGIVLINFFREQGDSVSYEQMRHVHGKRMVDAALTEALVDRRVVHYWNVVVSVQT